MNRYLLIRRLRGPAFLLLLGIIALLHETGAVYHMWRWFWPLALILWGVLLLAERAALEMGGYPQMYPDSPYPYAGAGYPQQNPGTGTGMGTGPIPPAPGTSMVPANSDLPAGSNDLERSNGGQS